MGLGFRVNDVSTGVHWSYSGFNRFRTKLAAEIGIKLNEMLGFIQKPEIRGISWDTVDDPIKPFLDHSDCDGNLSPEQCALIEPRLKELVARWEDNDYDKENALLLAEAMRKAVKLDMPLEFC